MPLLKKQLLFYKENLHTTYVFKKYTDWFIEL